MKSSPRRGVDVFDFDEDDGVHDFLAGKYSGKLRSPSIEDHALPKRNSPECDVDAAECNPSCGNTSLHVTVGKAENKTVSTSDCCKERPSSHQEHTEFKCNEDEARNIVPENLVDSDQFKLNSDRLDSSSECEPIDVTSDVDESVTRSYSSSPASETGEDNDLLDGSAQDHCSGDIETDDMPMTVVLYPDYIIYRDNYYTEPRVIFSDSCIKILRSNDYENHEAFDFEWGCDDVVTITSQIFQRVETVMIKLGVLSKDTYKNVHQTAGIDDVKIFVVEPNWQRIQEEITSLNQRYNTIWVGADDADMGVGTDGDDTPGMKQYFPVFDESFEDVVYPKGEADAVSITKRDVDLLQPETFINDTIIDFYIKYLKNQIAPEERHKFHFFNSFFFRKLADMDKDPSQASDGAAAFQRVRKWTRKVDLFEKEFIFIPINFSLHWSLIVICHPGEAATFADENLDESVKVPCILHMDSIKGNHTGLKHLIQSYLLQEWKERKKEILEEVSLKFYNMRFVALELPQQENSFDCGLFLLHYLERFLAEVPDMFNPFKIERESGFLNSYWFSPTEASLKRALIQRLISELLKHHSQEVSSSASSDDDQIMESNVNAASHFLSARFDPGQSCQQNKSSSSEVGHGIELTLLSASSMRSSQCINESGLVLRDLLNPGDSLMGECQSFDQNSSNYCLNGPISSLEVDPETGEQFMFEDSKLHRLQMTIPNSQTGTIFYPSKESGGEAFGSLISLQTEHGVIDGPTEPSIGASDAPSDIAITEAFTVIELSSLFQKERIDEPRSVEHIEGRVFPSHESPDTPAAAEALQNRGNEKEFKFPTLLECQGSQHDVTAGKGIDVSDDVQMIDDDNKVDSNLHRQQPFDDRIGSGDDALNVDDGFVGPVDSGVNAVGVLESLVSLGVQLVKNGIGSTQDPQNIDGGFVGPIESARNEVKVLEGVVSLEVQLVENGVGSGDDAQMIVELPVVSDLPRERPVGTATGSGDRTQIHAKDDSVGLDSPEQKPVDSVAVGSIQIFEDASSGLGSHGRRPVENSRGLCENSQILEDALVLDSSEERAVENVNGGLGDNNLQAFEDFLIGPHSSEQIAVENVDRSSGDNSSQIFKHALVGPYSSEQRAVDNVDGGSCDNNSQVFEDALADLDPLVESEAIADHNVESGKSNLPASNSHNQELADNRPDSIDGARKEEVEFVARLNVTGLGDNVEMEEASSNGCEPAENECVGAHANEQILEINSVVQVSSQSEDNDVPIMSSNSVAPDSPSQHPAKRLRLSPSEERQV